MTPQAAMKAARTVPVASGTWVAARLAQWTSRAVQASTSNMIASPGANASIGLWVMIKL